jgi:hypothetical protein
MRIWDHPNTSDGWVCPICGTADDKPVTLVGIDGTEKGNIMRAEQFHVDCIDLTTVNFKDCPGKSMVYMVYRPKKKAKGE